MPASPIDELAASRVGVIGKVTVGDIINLVNAAASQIIERSFDGRIQDDLYNYKGFNNITDGTYRVSRYSKEDGTVTQLAEGVGLAPTTLLEIQSLTFI